MELSSDGRICDNLVSLRYGIESRGTYLHSSKHCNIVSVTFNSKTNQYIILDSRGISSWFKNYAFNYSSRLQDFGSYKFNLLRDIIYCRSANVYFGLSKDYGVKVYNLNFIEIFSIATEGTTISRLVFDAKRSELITVSRNKFQFWKFTIVEKSRACEGLKLQRQYNVPDGALITNAEYDAGAQRLYLVCDHDIWCYDVFGECFGHFVHSRFVLSTLTVCAYSRQANALIAGTSTGEIPIYSSNGGLLITLLNHTRIITALIAHPSDGNLFISSSLDGTIKIFSLQMFEEIFSINVFTEGVHWMKLRSNHSLYCASPATVRLFDLNHVCSFWTTVRCAVKSINVYPQYENKSSHIVVHGTDKCIRIYSKVSGQKRCTILPPPESFTVKHALSFSYDRTGNVVYILFNERQLWIYLTRTDPATRVAVWNIQDIIRTNVSGVTCFFQDSYSSEAAKTKVFGAGKFNERKEEEKVKCLCTETISRDLYRDRLQADDSHNFNLLMCGLSNGAVYFLDPSPPVSVILGFRAHPTSPVLELKTIYSAKETRISTLIQTIDNLRLRIWSAKDFKELHSIVITTDDITVYSVKFTIFVSGNSAGQLRLVKLKGPGNESYEDVQVQDSNEHSGSIDSVDVLEEREFICSCGNDNYIRLWNFQKYLLAEIKFDETLCCAAFLGNKDSLLFGFKSQLFTVSFETLNLPNEGVADDSSSDSCAESIVYEDPHVRQEIGRHVEFKTEDLENYLIPYPYLSLESKWMHQNEITDEVGEGDEKVDDGDSSHSGSSYSELYARTEVYADSLCSGLSQLDFDIEMPRCSESPHFSCDDEYSLSNIPTPVVQGWADDDEIKLSDGSFGVVNEEVLSRYTPDQKTVTEREDNDTKKSAAKEVGNKTKTAEAGHKIKSIANILSYEMARKNSRTVDLPVKKRDFKTTKSKDGVGKQELKKLENVKNKKQTTTTTTKVQKKERKKKKGIKRKTPQSSPQKTSNLPSSHGKQDKSYQLTRNANHDDGLTGAGRSAKENSAAAGKSLQVRPNLRGAPSIIVSGTEAMMDENMGNTEGNEGATLNTGDEMTSKGDNTHHLNDMNKGHASDGMQLMDQSSSRTIQLDDSYLSYRMDESHSNSSDYDESLKRFISMKILRNVVSNFETSLPSAKSKNRIVSASYRNIFDSLVHESQSDDTSTLDYSKESVIQNTNNGHLNDNLVCGDRYVVPSFHSRVSHCDTSHVFDGEEATLDVVDQPYNAHIDPHNDRKVEPRECLVKYTDVIDDDTAKSAPLHREKSNYPLKTVCFGEDVTILNPSRPRSKITQRRRKSVTFVPTRSSKMKDSERSRVAVMALNRVKRQSKQFISKEFVDIRNNVTIGDSIQCVSQANLVSPDEDEDSWPIIEDDEIRIDRDKELHIDSMKNDSSRIVNTEKSVNPAHVFAGNVFPMMAVNRFNKSSKAVKKQTSVPVFDKKRWQSLQQQHILKLMNTLRKSAAAFASSNEEKNYLQPVVSPTPEQEERYRGEHVARENSSLERPAGSKIELTSDEVNMQKKPDDVEALEESDPDKLAVPRHIYMAPLSNEASDTTLILSGEELLTTGVGGYHSRIMDDLVSLTPDYCYNIQQDSDASFPNYSSLTRDSSLSPALNINLSNIRENKSEVINKNPDQRKKVVIEETHSRQQKSRISSGYGTNSPTSEIVFNAYNETKVYCEKLQKRKKRLSVNSSPLHSSGDFPDMTAAENYSHESYCRRPKSVPVKTSNQKTTIINIDARKELIQKLEHKMSGQPYRFHRPKNADESENDQVKLMFLKSSELGHEFLRFSKKRSISIPSKGEFKVINKSVESVS